ncbi:hypothetical protein N7510_004517 [Penicillium lagena]|uniref:uncharacterized protein n=1 Tax=Penicillium lagena TaxID=94218 RepID=UPI0025400F41|nr:uncharacterized protein N7510_004517 [Penicillium lagena]KAJ5620533.1 hypothetical protein N7510_004517 [Penicillium lagena]
MLSQFAIDTNTLTRGDEALPPQVGRLQCLTARQHVSFEGDKFFSPYKSHGKAQQFFAVLSVPVLGMVLVQLEDLASLSRSMPFFVCGLLSAS